MRNNKKHMVTPTGTILYGHLKEKRKTDFSGRPIREEDQVFEFTLQIEKTNPGVKDFLAQLYNFAMQEYSSKPQVQQWIGQGISGAFSWKIKDNDLTGKGDPNCYQVAFRSKFAILACDKSNQQIPIDRIYDGCLCDVSFNAVINGQDREGYAGLYLNPQIIRFVADGNPRGGVSIENQFANAPAPYIPESVTVAEQPQTQPVQPQPHNAILDAQPQQPMQQQPQTDAYIDDDIPF